ncbi:TRAP transporter small permease [Tautonia sociabilis]|uniref:TRAP transporter small permease n=1 Tax=Tautonia sociabilis TaxID=2080755 RepID=A0A432ML42_9BACT|nr:TRAP transporter small permease [Tautonia sociabilis]RUL87855.1 TRAP transporter small permease [Tautonia sociabilis]
MSRTMRKALSALAGALALGLEAAVIGAFAALVLVVLWGVGSRFVLNAPSRWTEEVAIFLLMWVALLGAAVAFRRRQHLGVDALVGVLHPAARLLLAMVGQVLVAVFALAVLIVGGAVLVRETLEAGQVTPATGLPMGYVYLAAPISGAFILLFAVERFVGLARAGLGPDPGPAPPLPDAEEGP